MVANKELLFGLVAPLGIDLESVFSHMEQALEVFRYQPVTISITQFLQQRTSLVDLPVGIPFDDRIDKLQGAGNRFRQEFGRKDAMALAAIAGIVEGRAAAPSHADGKLAYLVRQLKTPEEAALMRRVYGDRFQLIGVFSPLPVRTEWLAKRIAKDHKDDVAWTRHQQSAERLMKIDEKEDDEFGQQVRELFPQSDVFLLWDGVGKQFDEAFRRFLEGLHAHPQFVPTTEEFLMAQARLASLRSADLSRQVGAVIANRNGSVVAVGRNDYPAVGGGVVSRRDNDDGAIAYKRETLAEVLEALNEWLRPEQQEQKALQLASQAIDTKLKATRLMSLGEFGRMVHAEMSAITDAAARGVPVHGQVMFCTTFPCQNCAKHLMAAGLRAIVTLEPYPKSLVRDMYRSETEEAPLQALLSKEFGELLDRNPSKFFLMNYIGVAPRNYERLFSMHKRKGTDGNMVAWDPKTAVARVNQLVQLADTTATEDRELAALRDWMAVQAPSPQSAVTPGPAGS